MNPPGSPVDVSSLVISPLLQKKLNDHQREASSCWIFSISNENKKRFCQNCSSSYIYLNTNLVGIDLVFSLVGCDFPECFHVVTIWESAPVCAWLWGINWHLLYVIRAKVEWLDPQEKEEILAEEWVLYIVVDPIAFIWIKLALFFQHICCFF